MSLTDAKSNWIWAVKEGSPIGSNSQTQDLQQHTNMDSFSFDLTKARGGSTLNPFQASSPASPSSSSSASPPSSTGASGGSGAGAGEGSSGGGSEGGGKSATDKQDLAHGILMAVAFLYVTLFREISDHLSLTQSPGFSSPLVPSAYACSHSLVSSGFTPAFKYLPTSWRSLA